MYYYFHFFLFSGGESGWMAGWGQGGWGRIEYFLICLCPNRTIIMIINNIHLQHTLCTTQLPHKYHLQNLNLHTNSKKVYIFHSFYFLMCNTFRLSKIRVLKVKYTICYIIYCNW